MMGWLTQNALLLAAAACAAFLGLRKFGPWLFAKLRRVDLTPAATSDDVVDAYALLAKHLTSAEATEALREKVWPAVECVVCNRRAKAGEDS